MARELEVFVYKDTRTIQLMDRFEEGQYGRLVICNFYPCNGTNLWLHIVVERSNTYDYCGEMTFSEYKKGKKYDMVEFFVAKMRNVKKGDYLELEKPYLLKAQNSMNRVGYGWQDGCEGTLYGETTEYCFVGAYVDDYRVDKLKEYDEILRKKMKCYSM